MPKFTIRAERTLVEIQDITFEAATLADAFRLAAVAYSEGTSNGPYEYDFDDCGHDVTDLDFTDLTTGKRGVTLTLSEAEEIDEQTLVEDYGV